MVQHSKEKNKTRNVRGERKGRGLRAQEKGSRAAARGIYGKGATTFYENRSFDDNRTVALTYKRWKDLEFMRRNIK